METDSLHLDAASRLPARIRFGTSSWTYEGWKGLIYTEAYRSDRDFKTRSLQEYGAFPWFRTLGLDSSFYAPPKEETLERYASQLPDGMEWCSKVWEQVTVPRFGRHRRYGAKAGTENPDFLNPELFCRTILPRFDSPRVRAKTGPFLFQFQSLGPRARDLLPDFLDRLDVFFSELPTDYRYAVEVRSPEAVAEPRYFEVLNRHGVAHVFNHWTGMPPLIEQMRGAASVGGLTADFYVARLLTPIGMAYSDSVRRFAPFDRLQEEQPEMRDDVVRLAARALKRDVDAYVLVNNRVEGCSPRTVAAIGLRIVEELGAD